VNHATFCVETYGGVEVHLIWPVDGAGLVKFIKRRFKVDVKLGAEDPVAGGCVDAWDGGPVIIGLKKFKLTPDSISDVAHECCHAAELILRTRGIPHILETSETYAYLTDSLVRRCLEKLMRS
jgi:hypothetical protein